MEVVAFVVCMAIIAQINAAPTPDSGSSIAHHNNEFDLPPMARGGFEMTLNVSIVTEYEDIKDKLKAVLLPGENVNQEIVDKYCGNKKETPGIRICIMPNDEFQDRSGRAQSTFQKVSIKARLNREGDTLRLSVGLNDSHNGLGTIPLEEFENLKHFSVAGIQEIVKLQFDFTNEI